jgi:hypothetical protein
MKYLLALLTLGLVGAGTAQAIAASGESRTPAPPEQVSLNTLHETALRESRQAGEPSPTVEAANGSLEKARTVVDPQAIPPGAQVASPGSSVYLVTMRGHFTLGQAGVPRGFPTPAGTVMDVVIDSHTGFVLERHVGPSAPDLPQLGSAITVLG